MSIEATSLNVWIVVVLMAIVTLATRWGGVYLMNFVPLGPRVRRFIQAMSSSVLVALITPIAVSGDTGARLALLATAAAMLVFKRPLLAIGSGIFLAAMTRMV